MREGTEKMVLKEKYVEKTNMLNLKLRDSRESEHIFWESLAWVKSLASVKHLVNLLGTQRFSVIFSA